MSNPNNRPASYSRDASIVDLFLDQVAQRGEAGALSWRGEIWSYAKLNSYSNQIAHRLRDLGVGHNDLIGVCAHRHPCFIAAMLGVLKSGGAYVPLDPSYPSERLKFILEDTEAPLVIAGPGLLPDLLPPDVVRLEIGSGELAAQPTDAFPRTATATDLAYVMYTSGSTGQPKGVEVMHRNVVRLVNNTNYVSLEPGVRILQLAAISFDATTFEVWGPLLNGGVCVLFPERTFSLEALEKVLKSQRIECLFLTTALYNTVIEQCPTALSDVRQLFFGGEAASLRHTIRGLELLPATQISNIYGPTEGTTFSTYHKLDRDSRAILSSVPIGVPVSNTQVHVLDESGGPVPPGSPGELCIGGDGVARGYHKRPDLNARYFVADHSSDEADARLYRSGDRVCQLPDGRLSFLGRFDAQIKIRGFRVEPGEVEACLETDTQVRQSVVGPYRTPAGENALVAYILVEAGAAAFDRGKLLSHLKRRLPEYMIPSAFIQLDAFPIDANGKVDRKALPAPSAEDAVAWDFLAPTTHLEFGMATAWQRVLGVDRVGINDDFFEVGGSSLSALRLVREIKRSTGMSVDLAMVFRAPTVAKLISALDHATSELRSVVVPLNDASRGTPLFCLWGTSVYRDLAEALDESFPVLGLFVAEERQLLENSNPSSGGVDAWISIDRLADEYCDAILRHQKTGPFRLAGLSFGGLLAIEVASRLQSRGETVEIVYMFDTMLPQARNRNWTRWLLHILTEVWHGRVFRLVGKILEGRYPASLPAGRRVLGLQGPDNEGEQQRMQMIRLSKASAMRAYAGPSQPLDAKVFLVKAKDKILPWIEYDHDYGWGDLLQEIPEQFEVSGNHMTVIRKPNVDVLAAHVHAHCQPKIGH